MHLILTLAILLGRAHAEGVVLSITFSDGKLAGVDKDAESHRQLAEKMGLPLVRLKDDAGDKSTWMAEIAKATADKDPVVLMYAGHGLAVKPPLTKAEQEAKRKTPAYPTVPESDDEPPPPLDPNCRPSPSTDFLFASERTQKCANACKRSCDESCSNDSSARIRAFEPSDLRCRRACPKGAARRPCLHRCDDESSKAAQFDVYFACKAACQSDTTATTCGKGCAERYALSANELSEVLKGKHLVGLVDACESGALKQTKLRGNLFAAADYDVQAQGKIEGGVATQSVMKALGDAACDANERRDGKLTVEQMLARSAKAGVGCIASNDGGEAKLPPVRTFDYQKTCAAGGAPGGGGNTPETSR